MKHSRFLIITLLLLVSCSSSQNNATIPGHIGIRPMNLLLTTDEMPTGWNSYEPFTSYDSVCFWDCASIQFGATKGEMDAEEEIFLYPSEEIAKQYYQELLLPYLSKPSEWDYISDVALLSNFGCYTYTLYPSLEDETRCHWTGLYDKYVVDFGASIIAGKMSYNDLEKVTEQIDQKMLQVIGSFAPTD